MIGLLFIIFFTGCNQKKCQNYIAEEDPLNLVSRICDKLIEETPYKYELLLKENEQDFKSIQTIDFARTFGSEIKGTAYAFTKIYASETTEQIIELEHSDGCRIWLNGKLIYESSGQREATLITEERCILMSFEVLLDLSEGQNSLLIESSTGGEQWIVSIQPPCQNGAVTLSEGKQFSLSLEEIPLIDKKISCLTSWLLLGPFDRPIDESILLPISQGEIQFGIVYPGYKNQPVAWTIPRIEVLGDVIDEKEWGTNYNWNYHNGGVAWAMQMLSEVTGEDKYKNYASDFCDFHLNGKPFVNYQVNTLHAFNSANSLMLNTPLLDFTLAPSLPFINRLLNEPEFVNRERYAEFIDSMIHYARYMQIRFPGMSAYTRTSPEKYTTWTDDLFMGIPFLVLTSKYLADEEQKQFFLNDAARQVLDYSKITWDPGKNLFRHASFSEKPAIKTVFWSRANGWGIWAITELLSELTPTHPDYEAILSLFRRHVEALAKLQGRSGLWRNVLVVHESREEVSGSAIFTLAMARGVRYGWLEREVYEPVVIKAWNGIKEQIEPDGTVHNICYGTMCSDDLNYYLQRPFYDNDTHGIFAVIIAGIEVSKMLETD